jgi:hypothetical protein
LVEFQIHCLVIPDRGNCKTSDGLYARAALQDLRVTELRALAQIGATTFMEVTGILIMRHGRRLFDHANHPDPMMSLDEASVRFHTRGSSSEWQSMPRLTVNREKLVLVAPSRTSEATVPFMDVGGRELMVSFICGQLQVSGTVLVPPDVSLGDFVNQSNSRFVVVSNSRVRPHSEGIGLGDFQEPIAVCYVNAGHIDACLESEKPNGQAPQAQTQPETQPQPQT